MARFILMSHFFVANTRNKFIFVSFRFSFEMGSRKNGYMAGFYILTFVLLMSCSFVLLKEEFVNSNQLREVDEIYSMKTHQRIERSAPNRKLLSANINELRQISKNDRVFNVAKNMEKPKTTLEDVFISVKTSGKFHATRLPVILKTWWTKARNQVYFFTDVDDAKLNNRTMNRMINTHCQSTHNRRDLSCKMGKEYDAFMDTDKSWWCHFDDDNYVNVGKLVEALNNYDPRSLVYLGKPSLGHSFGKVYEGKKYNFWFATGGAGICLSRASAERISVWARHGKFADIADALKLPDDVALGFIVSGLGEIELSNLRSFHSHLEQLSVLNEQSLTDQVSLSYHLDSSRGEKNVLSINKWRAAYTEQEDPTRFKSLHCLIYPYSDDCS